MPRSSARGLNRRSSASGWPGEKHRRDSGSGPTYREWTTVKIRGKAAAFSWLVAPLPLLQLRNSAITSAERLHDLGERRPQSPVAVRAQHEGVSPCSSLWSSLFSCSRSWPRMPSDELNGRSSISMTWSGPRGSCRLLPTGKRKRGLEPRWGRSLLPLPASPRYLQPPKDVGGASTDVSVGASVCSVGKQLNVRPRFFGAVGVFPVLIRPGRCDAHNRRARPYHREALEMPARSRTARCRRSR